MIKIPLQEIDKLLKENYGIQAKIRELPGYEDLNYIIDYDNARSILKITVNPEAQIAVLPQVNVLEALNKTDGIQGFVPKVYPSRKGETALEWSMEVRV